MRLRNSGRQTAHSTEPMACTAKRMPTQLPASLYSSDSVLSTIEVFHAPNSLRVARAFSDPPMNLMAASATAQGVRLQGGAELTLPLPQGAATAAGLTVGVRASALRVHARPGDVSVAGVVELAEISGSDTFVHASTPWGDLVAQLTGVHYFELGTAITLHLDPAQAYVFGADGRLARAPARPVTAQGGR